MIFTGEHKIGYNLKKAPFKECKKCTDQEQGKKQVNAGSQVAQGGTPVIAGHQAVHGQQARIGNAILSNVMGVPVVIQNATLLQGNPVQHLTTSPQLVQMQSYATAPIVQKTAVITTPIAINPKIVPVPHAKTQVTTPIAQRTAVISTPIAIKPKIVPVPHAKTQVIITNPPKTKAATLRRSAPGGVRKVIMQQAQNLKSEDLKIVSVDCLDSVAAREENELMEELKAVQESLPRSPELSLPTYDEHVRPLFFQVCTCKR